MPPTATARESEIERRLKKEFADTLDKGASYAGICIIYKENVQRRIILGVPYDIVNRNLEMGPYLKNIVTSKPGDYEQRKQSIPIKDIISFKRLELSTLLENSTACSKT